MAIGYGVLVGLALLVPFVAGIVATIIIIVDAFGLSIEDGLLTIFMPFYLLYYMFAKLRRPTKTLLISLAMVGPFSGVAGVRMGMNSLRDYMAAAKQFEARKALPLIAHDVVAYVNSEIDPITGRRAGLPPNAEPVPKSLSQVKGIRYMSSPNDWSGTWHDIHYSMPDPQYFQYHWQRTSAAQGVVRAVADLNGDGSADAQLELSVQCSESANGPSCQVAPDIVTVSEWR
jgi:hypothetical protein